MTPSSFCALGMRCEWRHVIVLEVYLETSNTFNRSNMFQPFDVGFKCNYSMIKFTPIEGPKEKKKAKEAFVLPRVKDEKGMFLPL